MKLINGVERSGQLVTLNIELPIGYTSEELANQFKQEFYDWLRVDNVQGKTVRFKGRMLLAMAFAAGYALRNAKAANIDVWLDPSQTYYRAAGIHDPVSPVSPAWDVDMIVKVRLFGYIAEVKIMNVAMSGRLQLQVERGQQRAWIDASDVIEFVRYADPGERI